MHITHFLEHSSIREKLARAVIEQFGGWKAFCDEAEDVVRYGIDGGFGYFVYYADTVPFAQKHRTDILALAESMRADLGEPDTLAAFIAGFGCLHDYTPAQVEAVLIGMPEDDSDTMQVCNALAWFAGEEVCRAYCDMLEQEAAT